MPISGPRNPSISQWATLFVWYGPWSSSTAYIPYNVVYRSGSAYISVSQNSNVDPATDNGSNWQLMVQGNSGGGGSSTGADSITGTTTLTLVNDTPTPGNNKLYGTNGSGVLGYQPVSGLSIAYTQLTGTPSIPTVGTLTAADSLTGGGAMTGNISISLVNDSASPGNSMLYGTNGSGVLGWYAQPVVPTVGTLTTSDSITGGGAMTGNLTILLSGDSASPGNSKLYGTNGSGTKGWYSIPTVGTLTTSDSLTGGGAMSGNLTITLVNDSASPGNSKLYGTNGSGTLGWYAQPTVGTLTTSDSITGGGAMSGNLTILLSGDAASPGNSMLYGTNGSGTKGWYAIPTVGTLTTSDSITGGGAMSGNLTILLSGDSASPGNSMLYGTNSSGTKGWYAQPSGGGSGNPYITTNSSFTIPPQGSTVNVTVASNTYMVAGQTHNITDGTSNMTGLVVTVSGTTITYMNCGGGNTSGTMGSGNIFMLGNTPTIWGTWPAGLLFIPAASTYPTFGTVNSTPVLQYADSVSDVAAFMGMVPYNANVASGAIVRINWVSPTATTGNAVWGAAIEYLGNATIASDHYGTQTTTTAAVAGTVDVFAQASITISSANLSSLVAGAWFRLQIMRLGGNASDTVVGTIYAVTISIESAA